LNKRDDVIKDVKFNVICDVSLIDAYSSALLAAMIDVAGNASMQSEGN